MDEPSVDKILKHLRNENAQKRVQEDILQAREDATVTIGRAAQLFNFSESQLRDWEGKGLLTPRRSKGSEGQRLYDLSELDKLALIKELLAQGYSLSSIPFNIGDLWHEVISSSEKYSYRNEVIEHNQGLLERISIDAHVEKANEGDFWRYYISQTVRLTLSLIFEDIPETISGIILPLARKDNATHDWDSENLSELGPCLIGWRDQDRTFYTFYEEFPSFAFYSDFRIRGLQADGEEPQGRTFVVIQRKTRVLLLSSDTVDTIHRLLKPIYDDIDTWLPFFKNGPPVVVHSTTILRGINNLNSLLTFLTNRIILLGEKNAKGEDRWKFCCILLPRNLTLPLQMRTLFVQAQSDRSPHTVDKTSLSPDVDILSLSLRAFQSIHMLFRSPISLTDTTIVYQSQEAPIGSAIAMPIGGENGAPLGVLYVVSENTDMFGKSYQRVLRLMGRIIAELLEITRARGKSEERLRDIIERPRVVNRTLESYDTENKFLGNIGELLRSIYEKNDPNIEGYTSFISVDIDELSRITSTYGDQVAINLSKQLGDRISNQMNVLFGRSRYQIFHAYADRFYIMLRDTLLDRARETAEKLRIALGGVYSVAILPLAIDQPRNRIELKITVRLGVSSYEHKKLYDLLQRYPSEAKLEMRIADVRATIPFFLDTTLKEGRQEGGNCIISYYPPEPPRYENFRFALWSPPRLDTEN